ncbi:MAG: hypothetical protein DRQ99_04665 [Candidatus Parabeggiatoa sp. nov. 3]|nr:MAG: hypothetical protein DRQ99_04665 [Gammaproteobacteria bacterium]
MDNLPRYNSLFKGGNHVEAVSQVLLLLFLFSSAVVAQEPDRAEATLNYWNRFWKEISSWNANLNAIKEESPDGRLEKMALAYLNVVEALKTIPSTLLILSVQFQGHLGKIARSTTRQATILRQLRANDEEKGRHRKALRSKAQGY